VRVTFVIPFVNLTGGIRMVLDSANALHDAGHRVTVVYPAFPYRFHFTRAQQLRELRHELRRPVRVPWLHLRCRLVRVPLVRSPFLPGADVVVATSWPTAHDVARLRPSRGKRVHLTMHHEGGTGPEDRIRAVYRLPFHRITLSRLVAEALGREFGCEVHNVVPCGVNTDIFYPDGEPRERTVLMLYHPDPRKGATDGLSALSLLRERIAGLQVRLCGTVAPERATDGIPFSFHPSDAELRSLYSTSRAFLYPSRYEGFSLPPLEAMACGSPVVTTRVGAVPEYAVDRQNALVVEPGDVRAMADRLAELLGHPSLGQRLAAEGGRTAEQYSVRRTAPLLESALERARGGVGSGIEASIQDLPR
jgi:glycosyltransferase involved in cell wall biosynthesis